jgi:hypothetical protein
MHRRRAVEITRSTNAVERCDGFAIIFGIDSCCSDVGHKLGELML